MGGIVENLITKLDYEFIMSSFPYPNQCCTEEQVRSKTFSLEPPTRQMGTKGGHTRDTINFV